MDIALDGDYRIAEMLYPDDAEIAEKALHIAPGKDFSGNVYWLKRV